MKKVLILGAGLMTKTMANYLMDKCNYEVIIASRTVSKAEKIVEGKPLGKAVSWTIDQVDKLEEMVKEVDLAACMIPQTAHDLVASVCLKHNTHMLQTDYLTPYIISVDEEARKKGIVIMNEIGEDPGLDHMGAMETIDEIRAEGGRITGLASYGAGLPSFEHNRNPMGYKFSWSPYGLMISAKATAGYIKDGVKIDVPSIFEHHRIVDVEGIGAFETYPNRDCERYVEHFGLDKNVSLYRGLLRFVGYCNTMNSLKKIGIFNTEEDEKNFEGMTYAQMMASLINANSPVDIKKKVSEYLNIAEKDDIMERLEWLGLFEE
ncbi:MAG: saccharopine dehydrogenase NADP-binding domain-containing protein, partial [Bacteroidales bacterium]|nr:saccharopine dehydrogenase NADP-binding domain-containing protein [Bacteroidales bacterium]